ncbi:MAG TPA: hypothetical protein VIX18_03685, partial [Nitrospirota bacterium]
AASDNAVRAPEPIVPRSVRPVAGTAPGSNDANPAWSPDGALVAFERSRGEAKEIVVARRDGTIVKTVSQRPPDEGGGFPGLLPGDSAEASFNAGASWSPSGRRFVFMSNGGEGNYDLYLQNIGDENAARLTDHREKDGQPHWSRAANRIAFVSGRSGKGDVYLLDLSTRGLTRLTRGGAAYLYPQWSPEGDRLVMMHGSNENHDIILMNDVARPTESRKALTTWPFDDLRPMWSPDGKKIAFYSNYNIAGDPKLWSIIVIAADGSDPVGGDGLASRVTATDVIPDVEAGPAWLPDSNRIVFVKNDRQEYNPLYVADLKRKTVLPIRTDTKMNHDVSCSANGTIAFRAQVDQWDQIYIMKLKD